MRTKEYSQSEDKAIQDLLVGRRIVSAEMGKFSYPEDVDRGWYATPEGKMTLDDGTVLFLAGNDGGCSCGAGDYDLTHVATVDNVITGVTVESKPDSDEWDFDKGDYVSDEPGRYRIFVLADNEQINVATFEGSDGNGYYGTGFSLVVVKPEGVE